MQKASTALITFNVSLKLQEKTFVETGNFLPEKLTKEVTLSQEIREGLVKTMAYIKVSNDGSKPIEITIDRLSNGQKFFIETDHESELMDFIAQEMAYLVNKKLEKDKRKEEIAKLQDENRKLYLNNEPATIKMLGTPEGASKTANYDFETFEYICRIAKDQNEIAVQAQQVNRDAAIASQTQYLLLLKNWGATEGSEYLKNLIAHNFHFSEVAIVEIASELDAEVWEALEQMSRDDADFQLLVVHTPTEEVLNDYLRFADLDHVQMMELKVHDEEPVYYAVYDHQPFAECNEKIRLGIKLRPKQN